MSVRLTEFAILTGNSPLLQVVISTLNDSYVRDTTASKNPSRFTLLETMIVCWTPLS